MNSLMTRPGTQSLDIFILLAMLRGHERNATAEKLDPKRREAIINEDPKDPMLCCNILHLLLIFLIRVHAVACYLRPKSKTTLYHERKRDSRAFF